MQLMSHAWQCAINGARAITHIVQPCGSQMCIHMLIHHLMLFQIATPEHSSRGGGGVAIQWFSPFRFTASTA